MRFPQPILEALVVHSMLRALHFSADDMFLIIAMKPEDDLVIEVQREGRDVFAVSVGPQRMTHEEVTAAWPLAVEAWNTASVKERHAVFDRSVSYRNKVQLLAGLVTQGFVAYGRPV